MKALLNVVHFQRRPALGQVSIERVFEAVRRALPQEVACTVSVSPCLSRGALGRARNLAAARRAAGEVNHVVGDVHYLALGLPPRRTVVTVHDGISLHRLAGWRRQLFKWLWYDLPVRRAAVVTCISEWTRRELVSQVPAARRKTRVIHNCVGPEFPPAPKAFNRESPLVLLIGTGPNKNLASSIRALAGLGCRAHIVGKLSAEQSALLGQNGIRFTTTPQASDQEIVAAYRECDLLLFPSTYEGFGLPIIEANATGRPVVAGNAGALPEVAGEAACLVDPLDVEAIRTGVRRVCSDGGYRQALVEAGFENAKRFTPERIAAQYAAVYRGIVEIGDAVVNGEIGDAVERVPTV